MKIFMIAAVCMLVMSLAVFSAEAKQKAKPSGNQGSSETSAQDKVMNELADAVTRPISGADQPPSSTKSAPPGLAKKDETPPGWGQGKKTGWDKNKESGHQDSLVDKAVKAVAGASQ